MADDPLGRTAQYEAIYRGARDATFLIFFWCDLGFLGVFGVGLLWMTATALTNGTASLATFLLALFGAVITVLAGDELFHRLLGGTPVLKWISFSRSSSVAPTDGSREAELTLTKGIAVAKVTDATLHLVHVVKTGGLDPDARSILKEGELTARANEIVAAATEAAELASLEIITSEIEFGNPSKEIRNHIVTNDIHAVVMGTTGERN